MKQIVAKLGSNEEGNNEMIGQWNTKQGVMEQGATKKKEK